MMIGKIFIGFISILIVIIISFYLARKIETFINERNQKDEKNEPGMEYISCIAFDRPNPKSKKPKTDTMEVLERAPFWSVFMSNTTKTDVITDIMNSVFELANQNGGSLQGPAYMLLGRNKDTKSVDGWLYLPSIGKDGTLANNTILPVYHGWLRSLLFTKLYAVSDWLCNNPCDMDIKQKEQTDNKVKSKTIEEPQPKSNPECGCISKKECPFYNLPSKFSVKPRNIDKINTYSIYKLTPTFFKTYDILLDKPENLIVDNLASGSIMYEGCDTRLLSENRLYSLEMEKSGLSLYQTDATSPFSENCIPKPDKEYIDKTKVLKTSYPTTGKLPRLRILDGDISILSVNKNEKTKRDEFMKQWSIATGGDDPYTVILDNNGDIKLRNKNGVETGAYIEKI